MKYLFTCGKNFHRETRPDALQKRYFSQVVERISLWSGILWQGIESKNGMPKHKPKQQQQQQQQQQRRQIKKKQNNSSIFAFFGGYVIRPSYDCSWIATETKQVRCIVYEAIRNLNAKYWWNVETSSICVASVLDQQHDPYWIANPTQEKEERDSGKERSAWCVSNARGCGYGRASVVSSIPAGGRARGWNGETWNFLRAFLK